MNTELPHREQDKPGGIVLDDRYKLVRRIARGGFGEVYKAEDIALHRTVAVKLFDCHFNEMDGHRLQREAMLWSRLQHPNIVTLYSCNLEAPQPYLVMDLVEGLSLAHFIRREQPLPSSQVINYSIQILLALERAHNQSIYHRDVKPHNILLRGPEYNDVKLTDFGLAISTDASSRITQSGLISASVPYASPEQLQSLPLDGRSDLYSLGCVMFEALTGQNPFYHPEEFVMMHNHLNMELPPMPSVPDGLAAIVRTATSKDRSDRFESAAQMRFYLETIRDEPSIVPVGLSISRRNAAAILRSFEGSAAAKISLIFLITSLLIGLACLALLLCRPRWNPPRRDNSELIASLQVQGMRVFDENNRNPSPQKAAEAFNYFHDALVLEEKQTNVSLSHDRRLATLLLQCGLTCDDDKQSEKYCLQACEVFGSDDAGKLAALRACFGRAVDKNYPTKLFYAQKIADICERDSILSREDDRTYRELARAQRKSGNISAAEAFYKKALVCGDRIYAPVDLIELYASAHESNKLRQHIPKLIAAAHKDISDWRERESLYFRCASACEYAAEDDYVPVLILAMLDDAKTAGGSDIVPYYYARFLARLGQALGRPDLVRKISDCLALRRDGVRLDPDWTAFVDQLRSPRCLEVTKVSKLSPMLFRHLPSRNWEDSAAALFVLASAYDARSHPLLEDNEALCVDAWKKGLSVCSGHNCYSELQFLTNMFSKSLPHNPSRQRICAELSEALERIFTEVK